MPGDFLRRTPQITMKQFHAFRDTRPEEEKWELIDGVPMMMPPPTLVHQRIASNLDRLLNAPAGGSQTRMASRSRGRRLAHGDENYNPEPDVTVIDAVIALGQIYARASISSPRCCPTATRRRCWTPSSPTTRITSTIAAYCFVHQDRVGADLHGRSRQDAVAAQAARRLHCGADACPRSARSAGWAIFTGSRRSIRFREPGPNPKPALREKKASSGQGARRRLGRKPG